MNSSSDTSPTGCEADLVFGKRLQHPSSLSVAFFIFLIIVNLLTFPVTAVLNALVMISVQTKSLLRAHKSNVLLAFLALTAFTIGILVQPAFAAVLLMLLLNEPRGYCVLKVLRHVTFVVNATIQVSLLAPRLKGRLRLQGVMRQAVLVAKLQKLTKTKSRRTS